MTEPRQSGAENVRKRRGLFAAGAALVAAIVAKVTEQRVEAGSDGDVVLGGSNMESTETLITNTAADSIALEWRATGAPWGLAYSHLAVRTVFWAFPRSQMAWLVVLACAAKTHGQTRTVCRGSTT
jgi:hypothetical protein